MPKIGFRTPDCSRHSIPESTPVANVAESAMDDIRIERTKIPAIPGYWAVTLTPNPDNQV